LLLIGIEHFFVRNDGPPIIEGVFVRGISKSRAHVGCCF
jgi:hypothetical protein